MEHQNGRVEGAGSHDLHLGFDVGDGVSDPAFENHLKGHSKLDAPTEYPPLFTPIHHDHGRSEPFVGRVDVNPAFVIENPRDSHSQLLEWLAPKRQPRRTLAPLPEVTIRDFQTYLNHLRTSANDIHSPTRVIPEPEHDMVLPASVEAADISAVPSQFFETEFTLRGRQGLAQLLREGSIEHVIEKLRCHHNAVETRLLVLLKARSKQFLEALGSLQALRDAVVSASARAATTHESVSNLKLVMGVQPLSLIAAIRRRERQKAVVAVIKQLSDVNKALSSLGQLVRAGDVMGSVEVISQARNVLQHQLSRVKVTHVMLSQLDQFERLIGDTLVGRFASRCVNLVSVGPTFTLNNDGAKSDARDNVEMDHVLQTEIRPMLHALLSTRRILDAINAFQASLVKELRLFVRSEVAARLPQTGSATTVAGLADMDVSSDAIRALSPDEFVALLNGVKAMVTDILVRLLDLHELMERVLDWRGSTTSGSDDASLTAASRARAASAGMLGACVDAAERHLVKLLSLRREQSARMKVRDIRVLWDIAVDLAHATSGLLARAGAVGDHTAHSSHTGPLVDELLQHAKSMMQYFHTRNTTSLAAMLDAETWKQAEVPPQVQKIADAICASVSQSIGSTAVQSAVAAAHDVHVDASTSTAGDEDASHSCPSLTVKGVSFPLVGTGIMLIKMLGDYTSLAEAVPEISGDVVTASVELLRVFNTRTSALVLGAGAMQTANLKRITATHLALALQSLGAVLALLPSIRGALIMRVPAAQRVLLQELAKVTYDFMQHEQQLLTKFTSMVKDIFQKCCTDLKAVGWGNPKAPVTIPSPPVRDFLKGLSTLRRILQPLLKAEQLRDVFSSIGAFISNTLPVQFNDLLHNVAAKQSNDSEVVVEVAKHQIVADASYLVSAVVDTLMAHASDGSEDTHNLKHGIEVLQAWLRSVQPAADTAVPKPTDEPPSVDTSVT